jgi:hypothetical protein
LNANEREVEEMRDVICKQLDWAMIQQKIGWVFLRRFGESFEREIFD